MMLMMLKKACNGGDVAGCFNLGNDYYNGQGIKQRHLSCMEKA